MDFSTKLFSIVLGGAFGAVARCLVNISPPGALFRQISVPYTTALLYPVLSVVVGFIGVLGGVWLGRKF